MRSMTGYGAGRGEAGGFRFLVEVRSVNHRFLDVNVRLPGRFSQLESDLVNEVRRLFSRGKFDLFVRSDLVARDRKEISFARECLEVLKRIQRDLRLKGEIHLGELLTFWQIYREGHAPETNEAHRVRSGLVKVVGATLKHLETMRSREGNHLKVWFNRRLKILDRLLAKLEAEPVKKIVPREGSPRVDGSFPVAKGDVTEERVRLKSHLRQFGKGLRAAEPMGKKLDFLVQEMMREINTLGSKVEGVRAIHEVIEFKTELEKIREQVQNVE